MRREVTILAETLRCINAKDGCRGYGYTRGLCGSCYNALREALTTVYGQCTKKEWAIAVSLGLCLEETRNRKARYVALLTTKTG